MAILGALISGAFGLGQTALNNEWAAQRAREDRAQNYRYGEMAADNADKRYRALYNDFYSPEALISQYKEAGMSPGLLLGGSPGQGGGVAAQGTGAAGPQTPFMPMSLLDAAQVANITAQTEKTKAETKNIEKDTDIKLLQEEWQGMMNKEKSIGFQLTTLELVNMNGEVTSLYEIATKCHDYDQFINEIKNDWGLAQDQKILMSSEAGQKTMREIFLSANRFDRDIKVLSEEGVSAQFQKNVMQCLQKKGFAEQNAETALKQLEAAGEAADLTKEQKSAWNNIIKRLQKTNSTVADIVIVASMILNQAASHWNVGNLIPGK